MSSAPPTIPKVRSPRASRIRRWALALGLCLAALVAARVGWGMLKDGVRQWLSEQHRVGTWSWKLWGARREGFSAFALDTAVVRGPSVRLRLRGVRLEILWKAVPYPVPAVVSVGASRLDLVRVPSTSRDTSAPAFPDLGLPVGLRARLDTLVVHAAALDTGKVLVSVRGVSLESEGPRLATLRVKSAESPSVSAQAQASLMADWTESDTLRIRLSSVATSGCCASDTVTADASLQRTDLRLGRVRVRGRIEESRGWSDAIPALAKAPALHAVELDISASADRTGRKLHGTASLSTDSLAVVPPMDWSLEADVDPGTAKVRIVGALAGSEESNLDLALSGVFPRSKSLVSIEATGTAKIKGLGMPINGFDHPFDSDLKIPSLNRSGARLDLTTAEGSLINGQVRWKGLHWTLDGDIVPDEPWAIAYTDSLHLDGGGRAHGQDSAGTALFDVVARHPRIRMVQLDSLSTHLRIALPGPRLTFSGIEAADSSRLWTGVGHISIPDSIVHFELAPAWDPVGRAELNVKIGGGVRIQARDFPSAGLPLRLAGLPSFPMRVDADFVHDRPVAGFPATSLVTASARAMPYRDSVHASLEMSIGDSLLRIGQARVAVGESALEGGLVLGRSASGWTLDTLRASTGHFELSGLQGLVPGLPDLRGRLSGHILSQRGEGVSADLRLTSPAIAKKEGNVLLPDLVLWGERDTLHLGGWWPLAGSRAPFRLTATHLWDPSPQFSLLAFWGDVVRLRANGVFKDKRSLRTDFALTGTTNIPGTEARLRDLLVEGGIDGELGAKGFSWKATAEGTRGELQALAGNPLELRFHADADPSEIRLLDATLGGEDNGTLRASGRYGLSTGKFALAGHASNLKFDLGSGKRLELDSLVVAATPDSRINLELQGGSWHQAWNRSERLDVRVPEAKLTFSQARDWKKLSGDITVDKLLFTRNFADPKALWNAFRQVFATKRKSPTGAAASSPLLLDLRVSSVGDSIRISDNLGNARMGFDLQVAGPSEAPLLNGFMAADTEGGHFGYLRRDFHIDTLRMDWNTQPVSQGQFQLAGFRNIRLTCQDPNSSPAAVSLVADSCRLAISAQGTLDQPRLKAITSDCARQPGDDGTVGATIALATGCYPQNSGNTSFGTTLEHAGTDMLLDLGKEQVNELVATGLRDSRQTLVWVPDSVAVTDLSGLTGSGRDQLGLMALYHITPELDFAGIYQHTFTQSTVALGSSKPVLSDNYGLSLRYHIPFHWIEDTATRQRLENRVFLQCDIGESLDDNYQRQIVYQPSLRYRWEFW